MLRRLPTFLPSSYDALTLPRESSPCRGKSGEENWPGENLQCAANGHRQGLGARRTLGKKILWFLFNTYFYEALTSRIPGDSLGANCHCLEDYLCRIPNSPYGEPESFDADYTIYIRHPYVHSYMVLRSVRCMTVPSASFSVLVPTIRMAIYWLGKWSRAMCMFGSGEPGMQPRIRVVASHSPHVSILPGMLNEWVEREYPGWRLPDAVIWRSSWIMIL